MSFSLAQGIEEAKVLLAHQAMPPVQLEYQQPKPQNGSLMTIGWYETPETDWKTQCNSCIQSIRATLDHRLQHQELDPAQTCYWTLLKWTTPQGELAWAWRVVYFPLPHLQQPIQPIHPIPHK